MPIVASTASPVATKVPTCKMVVERGFYCDNPVAVGQRFCATHGGKDSALGAKPAQPIATPPAKPAQPIAPPKPPAPAPTGGGMKKG